MRIVSQKWNLCLCEIPEGSLTSFSTGGHSEKMVICELGSLSPPNTKSGFLIMDSPASKTVRHKLLLSLSGYGILLQQAKLLVANI